MGMASHYQSGAPLPEPLYQKLLAARNFRAGSVMMRQLHFAATDLELHAYYRPKKAVTVVASPAKVWGEGPLWGEKGLFGGRRASPSCTPTTGPRRPSPSSRPPLR